MIFLLHMIFRSVKNHYVFLFPFIILLSLLFNNFVDHI